MLIIPIEQRPHLVGTGRQGTGDSLGRWDGDTLVVEMINEGLTDENLRVVEHFARTGPDTIISLNMPATKGNYGKTESLDGARAKEK